MARYMQLADEAMRVIRQRRSPLIPDTLQPIRPIGMAADTVQRWLAAQCQASGPCFANPRILHREFCQWSGMEFTESAFVAELDRLGFPTDQRGMIQGLLLGADFVAACDYERARCF